MSAEGDDDERNSELPSGTRLDGMPYKDGNTRGDGSYAVGKGRTPERTRFRSGDNRARGKREKGSKNLDSIWKKQLGRKLTIGSETKLASEWLVDAIIRRGISRSDRAAESALDRAEKLDRASERKVGVPDDDIIVAFLRQRFAELEQELGDDPGQDDLRDPVGSEDQQGDDDANT